MADTLLARLDTWRATHPDKVAYRFLADGETVTAELTYQALADQVDRQAAAIVGRCEPGDRVGLVFTASLEFIPAFLAVLRAGCVAVPLAAPTASGASPAGLTALLADAGPSLMISNVPHELADVEISAGCDVVHSDDVQAPVPDRPGGPASLEDLAFLQYTSGSTGRPKGVMVTHANIMANQRQIALAFGQGEDAIVVSWLPLFHDMGLIGAVLHPLYLGATAVLMPPEAFVLAPRCWLRAITRYRATISVAPNFGYALCVRRMSAADAAELDLSSWQVAVNGSEPIRPAVMAAFARTFAAAGFAETTAAPCYGLAESTLLVTGSARRVPRVRDIVSCGTWSPDSEVVIVGNGRPLADGEEGEIWVRGASIAAGYWRQPEVTRQVFGAQLDGDDRTFLRTGDLGWVLDGELYVTGRLDDVMVIRGRNHHPQDIEDSVYPVDRSFQRGSAAVFQADAGVVVVQGLRAPLAALEDVAAEIRAVVAREHGLAVADVVLVPAKEVPKTSSGKIKRSACRARYLAGDYAGAATGSAEPGGSPDQVTELAAVIAEILETPVSQVRRDRALASLGLDSLRAVRLQDYLARSAGLDVPLRTLLSGTRLDDLEEQVRTAAGAQAAGAQAAGTKADAAGSGELAAEHELTRGQQALWILARDNPGAAAAYLLSRALELDGDVSEPALEQACAALVTRHPQLRSRFAEQAGAPRRETWAVEEQAWFTARDAGPDIAAELAAEARRPVDLARDPLFRMVLFRGPRPTLLLVAAHLVCDLRSLSIVLTELAEMLAGQPPQAGTGAQEEAVNVRRAIAAERRFLTSPEGEQTLRQWADELASVEPLALLGDRERTAQTQYAGAVRVLDLGQDTAAALAGLTRRLGCSPFAVLLAAYHAFLARIGGADDIVIGVPSSTRLDHRLAGTVGYFINMVPVRIDAGPATGEPGPGDTGPGEQGGGSLCTRALIAAAAMAESLDRVRLPLPDLVRLTGTSGDPSPIFGVSAGYYDDPVPGLVALGLGAAGSAVPLGPLTGRPYQLPEPSAVTGLDANFGHVDGSLMMRVNYSTEIFDHGTADRLTTSLAAFISAVLSEPDADVAAVPLSHDALAVIEPEPLEVPPGLSLADMFGQQAAAVPGHPAIVYGPQTLSYAGLERWSRHLAGQLLAEAGQPGTVALVFGGEPRFVVGMLAALRAGAAFMPMPPDVPDERLIAMLADSRPGAVLVPPESAEWLTGLVAQAGAGSAVISIDPEPPASDTDVALPRRPHDAVAYVVHTSGTTGRPKGVMIRDDTVMPLLRWQEREFGAGPAMRMAQTCSMSFDVGIQELFTVLFFGGTVCIPLPAERYSARDFGAFLVRDRVNALYATPTFVRELAAHGVPMPTVQVVQIAGELLFSDVVERVRPLFGPGCRIYNGYGPAETSINCAMHLARPGEAAAGAVLPVGRPTGLARLYVLDRYRRPLPPLMHGEIYIGGPGVGDGYLNQPGETAARFVPDTLAGTGLMYRTGDRGRVLADGRLIVSGRFGDQVKIRGYRVEPAEVEVQLRPLVDDCAVIVDRSGESARLLAFVTGRDLDLARLQNELAGRVPSYMIPARLTQVSVLPRTRNGKLDAARLVAAAGIGPAPSGGGRLLPLITGIWCQELERDSVNPDENFFDIGGSSLSLAKVAAEMSRATSLDIPPPVVYRYPTAGLLAAHLESLLPGSATPLAVASPRHAPPLAVQRRVRGRQAAQSRLKEI